MLIKRNDFMTSKASTVKTGCRAALAVLALCTAAIAPSAFAFDSPWTTKKVTVEFKAAELQAENGTQNVYAKLKRKAKSSCRSDAHAVYYYYPSIAECTAELMDSFIENAEIDALTAHHLAQKSGAKTKAFALK